MSEVPAKTRVLMGGDWNTRVGDKTPHINDSELSRHSEDNVVCARAPWLI